MVDPTIQILGLCMVGPYIDKKTNFKFLESVGHQGFNS